MKCKKCGFETEAEVGKFCPNCGGLVLDNDGTLKSSSADTSPTSEQGTAMSDELKGIWGLNTFPLLILLWIAIACGYYVASNWAYWFDVLTKGCDADRMQITAVAVSILVLATNLIWGILSTYALVLAVRRSSSYPKLTIALFWAIALIRLYDVKLLGLVAFMPSSGLKGGHYAVRAIIETCFALFWTLYFKKAVRISNTFVNAPANWRCIRRIIGWTLGALFALLILNVVR